MKKRNDRRKIYKYKYKPKKKRKQRHIFRKIFSVFAFIILLCGLVFLGYTIAAPLLKMIDTKSSQSTETAEISEITETTIQAETSENTSESEEEESVEETTEKNQKKMTDTINAITLDEDSLDSVETLTQELSKIKLKSSDYEITDVVVPLKIQGGKLKYASNNKNAQLSGAVDSNLTLDEIYQTIESEGFNPCAKMSLLNDSVYPSYNINASYVTESGSRWIDDDYNAGGKPWLDPSTDDCVVYLQTLMTEITSAGFSTVICTDVTFPNFRESDVEYLGEEVVAEDRYEILVSLLDELEKTAEKNDAFVLLETDMKDYISGETQKLIENSENVKGLVFDISIDELTSEPLEGENGEVYDYTSMEKDVFMASLIDDLDFVNLSGRNVIFNIESNSLTENEKTAILAEIDLLGYKSYILN